MGHELLVLLRRGVGLLVCVCVRGGGEGGEQCGKWLSDAFLSINQSTLFKHGFKIFPQAANFVRFSVRSRC